MAEIILITGATGQIGSGLVTHLLKTPFKIRMAVHKNKNTDLRSANIETVELDYSRPETVAVAFQGVDRAFLLVPFSDRLAEMNQILVDAAKRAGVKFIVRLSALGADPKNPIPGKWHGEADNQVMKSGIPFTILRPSFFMQNLVNFSAGSIKAQGAFYQPTGNGRVSYIDARDIAAMAAVVLTKPGHEGKIYDLTGPRAITNQEAADIISRAIGKKVAYVDIPEEAAWQNLKKMGMPEWQVEAMMNLMAVQKNGYASSISPAVEQITGRKPRDFEEFAREFAGAWK
ncbi:NAD(P)H azoreductase [Candidatus Zixiibacteriota bacterium]|nr:NAD(P)H azoreductase [candidate division Zixibacteria bacterium]